MAAVRKSKMSHKGMVSTEALSTRRAKLITRPAKRLNDMIIIYNILYSIHELNSGTSGS